MVEATGATEAGHIGGGAVSVMIQGVVACAMEGGTDTDDVLTGVCYGVGHVLVDYNIDCSFYQSAHDIHHHVADDRASDEPGSVVVPRRIHDTAGNA